MTAAGRHTSRLLLGPLGVGLLALALSLPQTARADIFADIVGRCPTSLPSYSQIVAHLQKLDQNPRCAVKTLGKTPQGRPLLMAEVTDPTSTLPQATLFLVASQHGSEPAGACATLALLDHFAAAPTQLERDILKYLRLVAVPVANPDGYASGRRGNAAGVDLNRDWATLSQPETRLIDRAVRQVRPDALIDLHELPAESSKPAYQENFLETIGVGPGLPTGMTRRTKAMSAAIATWMRTFGYDLNVYYDYPGDSLALCHRYFGLGRQLPTFLCEAKRGAGRSLRERAGYHILSALVVANYLMNDGALTGATAAAQPAGVEGPSVQEDTGPVPAPAPAAPGGPAGVELWFEPATGAEKLQGRLQVRVTGAPEFEYLTVTVAGRMRALGNSLVSSWPLDFGSLPAGEHTVCVTAFGHGDAALASREIAVEVSASGALVAR